MRSLGNALWDLHIECAEVKVGVKVKRMRSVDEVEAIFGNLTNVFVRPDATKVDVIEVLDEHLQNF